MHKSIEDIFITARMRQLCVWSGVDRVLSAPSAHRAIYCRKRRRRHAYCSSRCVARPPWPRSHIRGWPTYAWRFAIRHADLCCVFDASDAAVVHVATSRPVLVLDEYIACCFGNSLGVRLAHIPTTLLLNLNCLFLMIDEQLEAKLSLHGDGETVLCHHRSIGSSRLSRRDGCATHTVQDMDTLKVCQLHFAFANSN